MSELNNFDNHIKSEVSDFAPPVPPGTWEKIMAEREKRKPAGFWWKLNGLQSGLLLAAFLICGVIGILFYSQNKKPVSILSVNTAQPTHSTSSGITPDSKTKSTEMKQENITEHQTKNSGIVTDKINGSEAEENQHATDKYTKTGNKTPISTTATVSGSGNISSDHSNSRIYQPANNNAGNNRLITASGSRQATNLSHLPARKIHSRHNKASINSSIVNAETGNNDNQTSENNHELSSENNTTQVFNQHDFDLNVKNIASEKINGIPSGSLLASVIKMKESVPVKLPGCPTIEKNNIGNKKYIEFYAGPDYTLRSFSDTPNSNFLTRRKESTQILSAYSAGLRFTKVFNNGLNIRAGLNYSQINEKFTFTQNNLIQVTYIIDPNNGDTTGSYIVRGSRNKITYNHYHSIDIPITLGYEFGEGRLHANISAGIIVNAYSWQKGELLDSNYNPVLITTGKSSSMYQYKTNFGIGLTSTVSLYYKLTDQMYLLAEPYFRYNLSSVNQEQISLKQKYNTIGLRLGLRIDF